MPCCKSLTPTTPALPGEVSVCTPIPATPNPPLVLGPGEVGYQINIPHFSYEIDAWPGASVMVAQFNYEVGEEWTVTRLPQKPSTPTFVPCIKWRVGTTVYRYKLWEDAGERLFFPVMPTDGSVTVPEFFVIEIWTVEGQLAISNASGIPFLGSSDLLECLSRGLCDDIWLEYPMVFAIDFNDCVAWEDNA